MAVRNKVSVAMAIFGLVLSAGGVSLASASIASADTATNVYGCTFEVSASEWTLQSSCNSTHEIDLPAGVSLDGDNFTISPAFAKTSNSNNAAVGILGSNNVTIHNLTIDGTNGPALHGINSYVSSGTRIDHVTVKNMSHTGIVVNGSVVTVSNVTTSNNGWNGIDVDLGGGVTSPAILNIVGPMTQTDAAQILIDDVTKAATVNDFLHQYSVTRSGNAALYTRIYATDKQTCKEGGWKLGLNANQSNENQGQCVAHFESRGKNKAGDKKD